MLKTNFFILVALIVGLLTINGAFAETADSMPEIDQVLFQVMQN